MDSWTDDQIQAMRIGGNAKFRERMAAAGVPSNLSISQKYNSEVAAAYKAALKEEVSGKPFPQLPRYTPSNPSTSSSVSGSASSSNGGAYRTSTDSKGVEALSGESESDYVARQTRLREEARARMQAKFGQNGMQGIGSGGETKAPVNNYSNGGDYTESLSSAFSMLSSTVSSAASSVSSTIQQQDLGSKVSSGWNSLSSTLSDPNLTSSVKESASSGWGALSSQASSLWNSTTNSGSSENGISGLHSNLSSTGKYGQGISGGSSNNSSDHKADDWFANELSNQSTSNSKPPMSSTAAHASSAITSAPRNGGDVNGVEALPGETDAEYVARQNRLKEEAKARMKAKFGQGGMQGLGSSSSSFSSQSGFQRSAPPAAPVTKQPTLSGNNNSDSAVSVSRKNHTPNPVAAAPTRQPIKPKVKKPIEKDSMFAEFGL